MKSTRTETMLRETRGQSFENQFRDAAALCDQLECELNGIARAARKYLTNSTPSAYHMDEWHELKTALAAMPNVES